MDRKTAVIMSILSALLTISLLYHFAVVLFVDSADCDKATVDNTNSTLELVHILFHHGARAPVSTYPNDPYANDSFHPTGWGHITNSGKRDLFNLGHWLRKRYGNFLEVSYSPEKVYAQATASARTLMSLAVVLAGLFPPRHTSLDWNQKLNWQPVPIFSEPIEKDSLLLARTACPRYFEAKAEVQQLATVQAELARYTELLQNLTKLSGMTVRNADDVNSLYMTLYSEKEFGYKLPGWTKHYFPEAMQFLAEQSYIYNAFTSEMQKIKAGPFLNKMLTEMQQKRNNSLVPAQRRLFIYAAHDWTLSTVLSALKIWTRQIPNFGMISIFELHKNRQTNEFYVEIFLRNDDKSCIKQLQIPDCELKCPLNKLIELSASVLPHESYDQRCKPKNKNFLEPTQIALETKP